MWMLNSVALLCELLTFTILFYCFMERKFRIDAGMVVLYLTELVMFWMLEMRLWPDVLQILMYVNIFIFIWRRFREEKKAKIVTGIAGAVIITSGLQMLFFVIMTPIEDVVLKVFIANVLELTIIFGAAYILKSGRIKMNIIK